MVEGCPGCLLQQRMVATNGAPPKKELFFVALISLCNALPIASLFPFIYFMVEDFGIATTKTMIGAYAGYIGSALMFGRFLTSTIWGVIADRYGRKPVILIGTASIIIFNTMFGFSTNFWVALTTRFLLGICNGMLGAMGAYASEICSKENQAWGLSMLGTMWALGLIIGPAIGGYLAQPSRQYPSLFPEGSLFDRFPYALPCLCISAFAVPALVSGFWIPESLHNHQVGSIGDDIEVQEAFRKKLGDTESGNIDTYCIQGSNIETPKDKMPLWKNTGTVLSMYVYCVWGLHSMSFSEIFSLWAVSPTSYGGLGFTTNEVGNVLSLSGAALFVFQLFVIAPLTKLFGAVRMVQISAVLTIFLTAVYPLMARLNGVALWAVLILSHIIKNLLSASVVVGSSILINNSVIAAHRGIANGVSTSIMSLFKAIGPATAGLIFSLGQARNDAAFLPGMWMVFALLTLFALVAGKNQSAAQKRKSLFCYDPKGHQSAHLPDGGKSCLSGFCLFLISLFFIQSFSH
ncbi:hypothetical protein GOP47_0026827 [Adiantum capillus-veneris]|nr:hypothetical protein GOP47_0026827 [Adiantum capillus-veneris]